MLRVVAALSMATIASACTSLIVGKLASEDGSVFATHTNDGGATTDPRLVKVASRDHPAGALRPVWSSPESYPRYSGHIRGIPAYYPRPELNQTEWKPLGHIPEVGHTFGYFEQTYGAINEKQVGIGESTCSSVSWSKHGGKAPRRCVTEDPEPSQCALFSVDELSRVCMERSASSRACVSLMGELAEAHGFYGADGFEGTGESLLVVDPHEGFIFHVLSDPTGHSAIWAAQRVPDTHVGVVGNMFTIRAMNLSDSHNFLGTKAMPHIAATYNLSTHCHSSEDCDFTRTFSDGEYAHKYYSGRRMWGAYRLLAKDYTEAHLSPDYDDLKDDAPYPATVPVSPERKIRLDDLFSTHRDFYHGTPYDLSKGLAAGPYGTPNRFSGGAGEEKVAGNWERPISLFRTSDSHVVQARSWLPDPVGGVLWFGPHAPQGTVFAPFPAGMLSSPYSYEAGHQGQLDKKTAFWAHRSVAQLVDNKYQYASRDVKQAYSQLETKSRRLQAKWDKAWNPAYPEYGLLTEDFAQNADGIVLTWWELFDQLLFKYADGWNNVPMLGQAIGYPAWWLEKVGYKNGPPPVDHADGEQAFPRPPPKLAEASL